MPERNTKAVATSKGNAGLLNGYVHEVIQHLEITSSKEFDHTAYLVSFASILAISSGSRSCFKTPSIIRRSRYHSDQRRDHPPEMLFVMAEWVR